MDKMRVIHLLQSNKFSGAENVACQIIELFRDNSSIEMYYCSRNGSIRESVQKKNIKFIPLLDLNVKEVRKVINEYRPAIIHAHDMRASFVAAIASYGMKCRIISHIHNSDFLSRRLSHKSIAYFMLSRKYNSIIWVSNSCFEKYYFHKQLKTKSCVLYNIVNSQEIMEKANEEYEQHFDLVYVGRLAEPKNPQRLVKIVKLISEKKPEVKVAIVGSGILEEEVKHQIQELGLKENISLLGFMSNPLKVVNNSKIFVMTSDREGTPMAALEAMALSKPIISTPTDGLCDLIEPGITGYLDSEERSFAKHATVLLTDDSLWQAMSANIKNKFEALNNVEGYKGKMIELYGL